MSESFVARHRISGDTVFLKRVMQSDKWDAAALERELRIYEKLQRFESNAILAVRDVSRAGGYITLVTELADGGDLADHVEEQPAGCLTPKETKAIALEVGTAIQALHESDIIHRDLKPENILRSGGAWKLTDFGIAKNLVRLQTLQTFQMAGTPGYTAPEQFDGAEARASADIYSFGKIITFLLIGLTDADQIRFPSWRRVVQRCLARDPDQRSSLAAILTEIEAIAV
jgi:serine/threonine-protein kinase